jgi:hypothetical protein
MERWLFSETYCKRCKLPVPRPRAAGGGRPWRAVSQASDISCSNASRAHLCLVYRAAAGCERAAAALPTRCKPARARVVQNHVQVLQQRARS